MTVTSAAAHDSRPFGELLDPTASKVWADIARSKVRSVLELQGVASTWCVTRPSARRR